jgi:hypothetical protein
MHVLKLSAGRSTRSHLCGITTTTVTERWTLKIYLDGSRIQHRDAMWSMPPHLPGPAPVDRGSDALRVIR